MGTVRIIRLGESRNMPTLHFSPVATMLWKLAYHSFGVVVAQAGQAATTMGEEEIMTIDIMGRIPITIPPGNTAKIKIVGDMTTTIMGERGVMMITRIEGVIDR